MFISIRAHGVSKQTKRFVFDKSLRFIVPKYAVVPNLYRLTCELANRVTPNG